jgi:hypothetical protein
MAGSTPEVIRRVRKEQETPQWQEHFDIRAGIEGAIAQVLRTTC